MPLLRAGCREFSSSPIRPNVCETSVDVLANGTEVEGNEGEILGEAGEDIERMGLEEDDEVVKSLGDPSLPSSE